MIIIHHRFRRADDDVAKKKIYKAKWISHLLSGSRCESEKYEWWLCRVAISWRFSICFISSIHVMHFQFINNKDMNSLRPLSFVSPSLQMTTPEQKETKRIKYEKEEKEKWKNEAMSNWSCLICIVGAVKRYVTFFQMIQNENFTSTFRKARASSSSSANSIRFCRRGKSVVSSVFSLSQLFFFFHPKRFCRDIQEKINWKFTRSLVDCWDPLVNSEKFWRCFHLSRECFVPWKKFEVYFGEREKKWIHFAFSIQFVSRRCVHRGEWMENSSFHFYFQSIHILQLFSFFKQALETHPLILMIFSRHSFFWNPTLPSNRSQLRKMSAEEWEKFSRRKTWRLFQFEFAWHENFKFSDSASSWWNQAYPEHET